MNPGGGRLRAVAELRRARRITNTADVGGLLRLAPNLAEFLLGLEF